MDKRISSNITIQDFNNNEMRKFWALYYRLTNRYINNIAINKKILGTDNITVIHQYSNNFQNDINAINYNYELNLDYNLAY